MTYLFLGQDPLSKDIQLKAIKKDSLGPGLAQFNLDTVYAKELTLKGLQEKLLCLPVKSHKRIVVLKNAQELKDEVKDFIFKFVKEEHKDIILVLDITESQKSSDFTSRLYRFAKVIRFKEPVRIDTFNLTRQIELKRPDYALRLLNQLLKDGERPERILGGLRYSWEKSVSSPAETRKKLKLLINCDKEIKTGRLKPAFALEKLVISLCGPG